jgi:hypothetical protein
MFVLIRSHSFAIGKIGGIDGGINFEIWGYQ